jgi:ATP-dependent protease ClpP protease subunit
MNWNKQYPLFFSLIKKSFIIWGNNTETPKSGKAETIFKEPSYVETVDNHLYFYAGIDRQEILQLNKSLRSLDSGLFHQSYIQERNPTSNFLHVSSYGGSLLHGLAGMDAILQCKSPMVTIVDGCCASATTFLTVVGKRRLIGKYSFMLIHQLSAVTWRKFRELQDDNINFNKFMDKIKNIYIKYTKIPEEKIMEIPDHDLWFDAETCLKYGMIDEII